MLQHPEGVQLPLREEGAHLCEGQRGTADVFSEGERQAGVIHQRLVRHAATPSGGQLRSRRSLALLEQSRTAEKQNEPSGCSNQNKKI